MKYQEFFKDKKILVIGGTGTVGSKMISQLLQCDANVIRIFSRDEYKQFLLNEKLGRRNNLRFLIGDVRDYERVLRASENIDVIFHLAAMKHVPACEYNPFEAVKTNVLGTENVIRAAIANNVERVVFTSSDKAISPTNAMGATKLLAEKLISAADFNRGTARTIFAAVRFGNVMGSRGSVIPLFKKQIAEQGKVTVTNGKMSRFMMSVSDAVKLTMEAGMSAKGGEIFVLKMPVILLNDLVEVVIEETCKKCNIPVNEIRVEEIGLRPGEKMFEELMSEEEAETAYELSHMYSIIPVLHETDYSELYGGCKKAERKSYGSHDVTPISKEDIRKIILKENLI